MFSDSHTAWFLKWGAFIAGIFIVADFFDKRMGLDEQHNVGVKMIKKPSVKNNNKLYDIISYQKELTKSLQNHNLLKDGFTHEIGGFEIRKLEKAKGYLRVNFTYYVDQNNYIVIDRVSDKVYKDSTIVHNLDLDLSEETNLPRQEL